MPLNKYFHSLVFICLLIPCNSVYSQRNNSRIFIYEDSSARLSINPALNLFKTGNFKIARYSHFNMGYTQSNFWLAVPVDSSMTTQDLLLTIGNSHINIIEVYILQNDVLKHLYTTGDYYPFKQRPIPTPDFNFPLSKPGTYFAKVDKHNESLQMSINISSKYSVLEKKAEQESYMAFFMGMMVLMIIFGVYLFAITRQKIYLLYIFFVIAGWAWVLANRGFGMQYFWPNAPWFASKSRLVFTLLTILAAIHFMEAFVGGLQKKWVKQFNKILSVLIIIIIIIILGTSYSMKESKGWLYFQYFIPSITIIYLIFAFILLLYKTFTGNKRALFFLCSIFLLILAGVAQSFYNTGTISRAKNVLLESGVPMGYLLQLIFLTGGLVYRFNEYRKEKDNLLLEINKQQLANARIMMEVQQGERTQVADQLHDVAGSMLSAARMNLSSIIEESRGNADKRLIKTEEAVSCVSETIRNLSHALSPVMIEKVGFKTSIEKIISIFNASGKIEISLLVLGFDQYDERLIKYYNVLYSIIYEALNNIARHSKASYALVQVSEHTDCFTVVVEDNGIGMNLAFSQKKATHGLQGIESKVAYFNGQIAFDKNKPTGLIITIELPRKTYEL
ncbi:MAG: 7TM diverse intracellular signaling domain-containing protein [Ferruginibacter sp.]